jgi:hypothetical protein
VLAPFNPYWPFLNFEVADQGAQTAFFATLDLVVNCLTVRAIIFAAAPRLGSLSGMESGFGQQQRLGSTTSDRERSGR